MFASPVTPTEYPTPAERGFDPEFGARPLRRTIQRHIENELSRMVLDGRLSEGDKVRVGVRDGRLDFDVIRQVGEAQPAGGQPAVQRHAATGA